MSPLRRAFWVPAGIASAILALAVPVFADQGALSVSITPPLFQLAISPGESWSSSIKVINNNDSAVTYYAQAMDFEADGETGNPSLIPVIAEATSTDKSSYSLASWITLSGGPVTIAPGQAGEVPFTISVPPNAEPGGHYAAILVGTQPTSAPETGTRVNVSSYVSSLLLVQIKGDVIEKGRIREFSTSQSLYQSPSAEFVLRFENTGNTHVKPMGEVTIYNMWGKERGKIAINQDDGNFGNVLPKSIRRFEFSWSGDENPFDIGLYSAVATLSYGENEKQNVSATTYFWVVPIVPVSIALAILAFLIFLIAWFIKRYVRHALSLERERLGIEIPAPIVPPEHKPIAATPAAVQPRREVETTTAILVQPLREGVIDLRKLAGATEIPTKPEIVSAADGHVPAITAGALLRKYRLFVAFIIMLVITGFGIAHYFGTVLTPERGFQIKDVKIQEETSVQNSAQTQ
ncbi:MAG TPA: hypothetical protein VMU25_04515 [Candidatus Paceibacterota bacterium]|nr:hypothetical protein [Candidatus Paceibacterota bacterium]